MEVFDGPDRVAQPRDLTDHEHALVALLIRRDLDERVTFATESFGGEAQAAKVELFELRPSFTCLDSLSLESLTLGDEGLHICIVCAARGVSGRGL